MIISLDSGTIHIPTDAEYIEPRGFKAGPILVQKKHSDMEAKRRYPKEEEERRRSQRKLELIAALYNPMVSHDIEEEQKEYNQGPYDNVTFTEEELKKFSMTEASKEELKEIIHDTYVVFEFTAEGYILASDQRKKEMIANLEKLSEDKTCFYLMNDTKNAAYLYTFQKEYDNEDKKIKYTVSSLAEQNRKKENTSSSKQKEEVETLIMNAKRLLR